MRVKLFVEGKEVDRRYMGYRLLWRSDGVIYESRATSVVRRAPGGFNVGIVFFKGHPEDVVAFSLDGKGVFRLKKEKFKASSLARHFFISENEPGIEEYLGLQPNQKSRSIQGVVFYGF